MEFPNGASVDMKKYVNLPITWESVLDETHGTATVLITDLRQVDFKDCGVNVGEPFPVFAPLEITFENQNTVIRMIVARDTAEMVRKDGYPTWSHKLDLVDEAKLLEFEPVDNLTFKNPLPRAFDTNSEANWNCAYTSNQYENWLPDKPANGWVPPSIKSVITQKGTLKISDNASLFDMNNNASSGILYDAYELNEITLTVLSPSGKTTSFNSTPERSASNINAPYLDTSFLIDLNMEGEYFLEFNIKFNNLIVSSGLPTTRRYAYRASTYIYVGDSVKNNKNYTIKDVLDRLLSVTPTRQDWQAQKYSFRNNAEEYAAEESPEFTFTGKHLFEALLDVASYKKMFPALYKNEIYFRPFFNGFNYSSSKLPLPDKAVINSAIDQYCNTLDSYVENLVCINDSNVGSVVEPYANGYISGRSSSGSAITESSAVAPTLSPIYQTHGLEVFADGIPVGDIQAYLYETEDYEALSDTSAAYPYSKAYAIKYTRFSPNFTELSHRIEGSNSLAAAFIRPALANVVGAVSDASVGIGLQEYLSQYVSDSRKSSAFAEVLYRPTYTPVVNARVRQYKPYLDERQNATLFYNQQAEVVDSEAYGEHLKGVVQKLGNNTEVRVYTFPTISKVPTVGSTIDGKSVYNVSVTIYENFVQATICLVEYAELSKFIGVKNEIKTSDISTTKWAKRFINWEEFFVFTHDNTLKTNSYSITESALEAVVTFDYKNPLTCAMFTTYNEEGVEIVTAFSPVKHLAIGNSIYFQFETMDNFAVGYQSEAAPLEAKSVIDGKRFDRAQKAVRYCDTLGRLETMSFKLLTDGANIDNSTYLLTEEDIIEITADTQDKTLTVKLKKEYPVYLRVAIRDSAGNGYICDFNPNQTVYTTTFTGSTEVAFEDIYLDNREAAKIEKNEAFIRSTLAHAYPQLPQRILFDDSEVSKAFELNGLVVKKNSAECLKFACQYHFRTTERNFIIGSGMSNFSSLIGGECEELALFVGNINVNPYERHINEQYFKKVNGLPSFKRSNDRVTITLPDDIETYPNMPTPALSWAFCGKDRNGNWQLIFGENKQSLNESFNKTLYLVCRAKQ